MHPHHAPRGDCCRGKKCPDLRKVEDDHLRCRSCRKKLDGCCCHDYPGHFMSVRTEQCKKERTECCKANNSPPLPTKYCPSQPKLPFHFFQFARRNCYGKPIGPQDHHRVLPPLAVNKSFPSNLYHSAGGDGKSGCGCKGR